jgi:hypothetical protein
MLFDCKFDGRRKGGVGGCREPHCGNVYSGVVGIETVRTILFLSAMDPNLQVMAADVSNAFLYGKNIKRTMIKAGPEFGNLNLNDQYLIVEGGWYGMAIRRPRQPFMNT